MFSAMFKQEEGEFTATVRWDEPGVGMMERTYRLEPIRTALDFRRSAGFDPEHNHNPRVNGEQVPSFVLEMAGSHFETHWIGCGEDERLGLATLFANIFVTGASVVPKTVLPRDERTDPPRGGGYSRH